MRASFLLLIPACLPLAACKPKAGGGPGATMATQVVALKAQRQPITESVTMVGTVRANEAVEVKAQIAGIVETIHFEEGKQVRKGDLLIELDSGKIAASLAQSEAQLKLAESKFNRARDLAKSKSVSEAELDEARASYEASQASVELGRQQLKDCKIRAPFSGVVGARLVSPGQVVSPQQMLTSIADLDPVKIELNVPERLVARAALGQRIELGVAAFPGEKFTGEVFFIASQIDPVSRTAGVKAKVANPDLRLKPGMFASLDLTLKVKESAVVIPEAALMPQGERVMVVVADENMTAQMRPVSVGLRQAGQVEILSGLQGGETVVVEGWQKTRPGGLLKLAPAPATAPYESKQKGEAK